MQNDPLTREADAWAVSAARRHSRELLIRVERALSSGSVNQAFAAAHRELEAGAAGLAELLAQANLAGGLSGLYRVADDSADAYPEPPPERVGSLLAAYERLPDGQKSAFLDALAPADARALAARIDEPPPPPDDGTFTGTFADGVRLPSIEAAAEDLASRRLVGYQEFRALDADARSRALRVAGVARQEALGKLQAILTDSVREGGTLADFRGRVLDELPEGTFLSSSSIETTFRDAVQASYSAGMDRMLSDPVVGSLFVYEETIPIRDSRLSSMCNVAARSGIGGTAVYRRDDPVWQRIKPPRHPNCRCGRNPLTVEDAAERGVAEARKWLRTGEPPTSPAFVQMPQELAKAGL